MLTFPLLLTIYAGFTHAFETDHLLAVGNIVSQRNNIRLSMKDGVFWGLGHASTIFFIGILMILFKAVISPQYFHYFEATVGVMLIALAVYRLVKFFRGGSLVIHAHVHDHGVGADDHGELAEAQGGRAHHHVGHTHKHLHVHVGGEHGGRGDHGGGVSHGGRGEHGHHHEHSLAYGVGLVHGLAGSGALILVVMSQIRGPVNGLIYLLIFGTGCIFGMAVAAGLFSIPFSKKIMQARNLQGALIIISSVLCLVYGGKVIVDNLLTRL